MAKALRQASQDLSEIEKLENSLVFPHFTAQDAWMLGVCLRDRILSLTQKPVVINISLANSNQLLFHTATTSGTQPDNDIWVSRKRKTVLRWCMSSWYMHNKMGGDEVRFREKYALGDRVGEYAIHGGGVPLRVNGVEGVVAVVVVSGLKQEEDHMVIIECMEEYLRKLKS